MIKAWHVLFIVRLQEVILDLADPKYEVRLYCEAVHRSVIKETHEGYRLDGYVNFCRLFKEKD